MYDKNIDSKWQNIWDEKKPFNATDDFSKKKFYSLIEFPYPSGAGLHVGHVRAFMGMEAVSRMKRMMGYNVLFPIGFDAFGLPTENYAMKTGIHPRIVTDKNIETFTKQLKSLGLSFDFDRVIDTTDENYFKWTQWIFIKLFEKGLAYKDKVFVNYCPNCRVILANEESQNGICDRCDATVEQLEKEVWMLKITDYADKLLEELNNLDFPDRVKQEQINWIGKSYGANIDFKINDKKLTVYTTRPDTIFGVTYMAIAPEHNILDELKSSITNFNEIIDYRNKSKLKTEFERINLNKDKTGVEVKGIKVINPVTNESIPLYVTDYVMVGYGTGAIMAVPSHDMRDYEFAKKYNIPIKQVIAPLFLNSDKDKPRDNVKTVKRDGIAAIIKHWQKDEYIMLDWKEEYGWKSFVLGGIEEDETPVKAAIREMTEETGYTDVDVAYELENSINICKFYAAHKDINRIAVNYPVFIKLLNKNKTEVNAEEVKNHTFRWVSKEVLLKELNLNNQQYLYESYLDNKPYTDINNGILVNSDFLNMLNVKEANERIMEYIEEKGIGNRKTNYHMKDWAFARQRYWGEPLPIVKCEKCGLVALNESDLPLKLPDVVDFIPGVDGSSPLAKIEEFVNCKCPKCGIDAKRETDTMPQWAGSSWYYLRYIDPHNSNELASQDKLKYWLPVDWYNGGMEHVTRHLIYSRFWHRFLYDIGIVPTIEPYAKRTTQGLILGPDGDKMSKSRGNVINPDDIVKEYGADTLRTYILFIGDYTQNAPWNEFGVKGAKKFLDRVIRLKDLVTNEDITSKLLDKELNYMIKKVTSDLLEMKYNTAVACMMTYVNILYKENKVSIKYIKPLLQVLNPIAPHVTEELWSLLKLEKYIFENKWPEYDENKIVSDETEYAVLVNSNVRFRILLESELNEEEVQEIVLKDERLKEWTKDKDIKKVIVIKGRVVNIVV